MDKGIDMAEVRKLREFLKKSMQLIGKYELFIDELRNYTFKILLPTKPPIPYNTIGEIVRTEGNYRRVEPVFVPPAHKALFKRLFHLTTIPDYEWPTNEHEDLVSTECMVMNDYAPFFLVDDLIHKINDCLDADKFDYYNPKFRRLRLEVFLRDGETCAKCGATPKNGTSLTIDHIKPVSKYPDDAMDIDNLQVLCWSCNQEKSNKHVKDYRK